MLKLLNIYAFVVMFVSQNALSCNLTEQYLNLENELKADFEKSLKACRDVVSDYKYWFRVAMCVKNADAVNVGGQCKHMVSGRTINYPSPKIEEEFCNIFGSDSKSVKQYIESTAQHLDIQKCRYEKKKE